MADPNAEVLYTSLLSHKGRFMTLAQALEPPPSDRPDRTDALAAEVRHLREIVGVLLALQVGMFSLEEVVHIAGVHGKVEFARA